MRTYIDINDGEESKEGIYVAKRKKNARESKHEAFKQSRDN